MEFNRYLRDLVHGKDIILPMLLFTKDKKQKEIQKDELNRYMLTGGFEPPRFPTAGLVSDKNLNTAP